jgi:hypothetical protein
MLDGLLVVDPQQLDRRVDVVLGLDPSCGRALPAWEHGVIDDPPLRLERTPDGLGEEEVGGVIAVQVPDLPSTELERELPPSPGSGLDPGPGEELCGSTRSVA